MIWSDESRYRIAGSDRGLRIIRLVNERYKPGNIVPVAKFGGGSVMIWSCFVAGRMGPLVFLDGSVDQDTYVNCLSQNYIPWFEKLKSDNPNKEYIFQEDNATPHTGSYTTWWKKRAMIKGFDFWPSNSPDLNPIEHVWAMLEKALEEKRHLINNTKELREQLELEWKNIDMEALNNLVQSMPRRIEAVIDARGGITRY